MTSFSEILSPRATQILAWNADSAYQSLTVSGPGDAEAKNLLDNLNSPDLFTPDSGKNRADQDATLAGLWLWHDWLEESHKISQNLSSSTGSFWHAILHRREGDFSNSKYWYARCADHPVLAVLAAQAGSLVHGLPADRQLLRLIARGWEPDAFVDLIEQIEANPKDPRRAATIGLQRLEWRILFDHCSRR